MADYAYKQTMSLAGFNDDVAADVYSLEPREGRTSSVTLSLGSVSGVNVIVGLEPEGAEQLGQALIEAAAAQRAAREEVANA